MGEESSEGNPILKQLQFPVAVFACLQAGSVFYMAFYFNYLKEKYNIDDDIFDWFDFMLNAFALFGLLPGLLLKWLSPKKTAVLGGILIVLGQMGMCIMVSTEHAHIKENPAWVLGLICFMLGQGSCLVLFSCLQALMNMMTIQASHVIATCCISYYLGADTFITGIKDGLFNEYSFTDFTFGLAITAFVLTLINGVIITDEEDASGFFGKAVALTKGIIYKKTNYAHMIILAVYTTILLLSFFYGGLADQKSAIVLTALVVSNLFVPLALICLLDPENIKQMVGEPSDIEKKLSNKGSDVEFGEAAQRIDFWYLSIVAMFVIGTSRMHDENAELLSLHNQEQETKIEETFGVYEVLGAFIMGCILTFFRSKVRPSLIIVIVVLINVFGQLAMVWPDSCTFADPMLVAVASSSFAEGGLLVALACFCHEEYGTENFGLIYGFFLTFGVAGLFALDEIFFPSLVSWYSVETNGNKFFKLYGQWNVFLYGCLAFAQFICLILASVSHVSIVRREKQDGEKLVMVKF